MLKVVFFNWKHLISFLAKNIGLCNIRINPFNTGMVIFYENLKYFSLAKEGFPDEYKSNECKLISNQVEDIIESIATERLEKKYV